MPAKGKKFKHRYRNYIFNFKFWKRLKSQKNLKLTYAESKIVIDKANSILAEIILEEVDGFKMPHDLGYLVATKFIPTHPGINWKKWKETGKIFHFANLHTLGYSVRAIWYSFIRNEKRNLSFRSIYMFKTSEELSKRLSKSFANGKNYCEWTTADFVNKGSLSGVYNKKFKNKNIKQDVDN